MDGSFLTIALVAGLAALASPAGGALALWLRPSTLLQSASVGLAGGVLLGTFAFEMIPKALELSSLVVTCLGFALGFLLILVLSEFS